MPTVRPATSATPPRSSHTVVAPVWHAAKAGLASLALGALLASCGGGGGSATTDANPTNSAMGPSVAVFPYGLAQASPTGLVASSSLIAGGLGLPDPGSSTSLSPQQGLLSSQVDAVATGRLSLSTPSLLSVGALFDTSQPVNATCWGPSVAYDHHDDALDLASSTGTLPAGAVGMWADTESGSTPLACGAAELNSRTQAMSAQSQQAILLLAGLRQLIVADSSLHMPDAGNTLDLTSNATPLLAPLLSGVSVVSASAALNSDGSEYTYRLVLARSTGASAQLLELKLLHTPNQSDTLYAGTLQIALSYLSTDASIGCSDQRDSALRYKVARLTTLGYNRVGDLLSLRARSGQYCGNASLGSSDHMGDLGSLAMSGELDPAMYLTGSARGITLGWRQGFVRMTSDVTLPTLTMDFVYAWQDAPHGGLSHARMLAGHSAQDPDTLARTLALYSGHTDDITVSDGTLLGLICNDGGPGSNDTVQPMFQYQLLNLASTGSNWALAQSHFSHAPTNSCNASTAMRFDVNGDGALGANEGRSLTADLSGLAGGSQDVQHELLRQGFSPPTLTL